MKTVHKNDLISNEKVTDLAGNLVYLAGHGTRRLGVDVFTNEQLADLNEIISTSLNCDICGKPIDKKKEIIKRVGNKIYCKDCIDQPGRKS